MLQTIGAPSLVEKGFSWPPYWVETGWRDGPLTRERVFHVTHLGEVVLVRPMYLRAGVFVLVLVLLYFERLFSAFIHE